MAMKKLMLGAWVCVFVCLAIVALGLSRKLSAQETDPAMHTHLDMGPHYAIPTPAYKARLAKIARLDRAAESAMNAGEYARAEAETRKSLALGYLFPEFPVRQEILAAALEAQGKTQDAIAAYQVMAHYGDELPRNEFPYARLLLKTGRWAWAVAAYNKALPHLSNGNLLTVHSHFSPDIREPKRFAVALHIALGLTEDLCRYHPCGDRTQTLPEFQKALALEPNSDLASYYNGFCLHELGRNVEAKAAFEKAARVGRPDVKVAAQKELAALAAL